MAKITINPFPRNGFFELVILINIGYRGVTAEAKIFHFTRGIMIGF
jgi:hypothetical protein